jgi:hypothetical protein
MLNNWFYLLDFYRILHRINHIRRALFDGFPVFVNRWALADPAKALPGIQIDRLSLKLRKSESGSRKHKDDIRL